MNRQLLTKDSTLFFFDRKRTAENSSRTMMNCQLYFFDSSRTNMHSKRTTNDSRRAANDSRSCFLKSYLFGMNRQRAAHDSQLFFLDPSRAAGDSARTAGEGLQAEDASRRATGCLGRAARDSLSPALTPVWCQDRARRGRRRGRTCAAHVACACSGLPPACRPR